MKRSLLSAFAIGILAFLISAVGYAQSWLDPAWNYRHAVTVSNPGLSTLTDYQVQIRLDSSFDFSNSKSDGSDLRVTTADGTTLIPFWIETWSPSTRQGSVWVKVPTIPTGGTTVFLYWGNPNPIVPPLTPTEGPPIGPFTRATGNPIQPIGDPGNGAALLAENIVYDDVTKHYWMVFANYRNPGVGLVWSDNPTDPASWQWYGNVYNNPFGTGGSFAPHLLKYNGVWYLFFSDWSGSYSDRHNIVVITAASITGPYTTPMVVLSPDPGTWENWRVDEPYVFQRNDGKWIMVYMGDNTGNVGPPTERVGYAYADNILGPYTKYAGNPVLDFGIPGSFDAGTIADPWVVEFHGTYYIGYTVSSTQFSPWQTAYATTTDWQTFTKHGVLLPLAFSGWDAANSFRGAVTRIGDTYVFSYTGDGYQMGIATQPVVKKPPNIINNPDAVFAFYDGFDGTNLDGSKWSFVNGSSSQAVETGGQVTLTATGSSFVRIRSQQSFGMDYMVEARARHPQQGIFKMVAEIGLTDAFFGDIVRIADDFYWNRQAKLSGQPDINWSTMAQAADQQWHTFHVYRKIPNVAGFQIDDNPIEEVSSNVPILNLPVFLMSYTEGADNEFLVDWVRVRKFAYPEPVASFGVVSSNHPPQANGQTMTTVEDNAVPVILSGSDSDGDPLTYAVVIGPVHGTLSGQTPNLTYTPLTNYSGPDSFTFKVNDGHVDSAAAAVSIVVTVANDPPVANGQSVTTLANTPVSITLTGTDVDGDALTYAVVSGPAHGTLSGQAPNLTYTPVTYYSGPDSFTFKVNDGQVDSATAAVSIVVTVGPSWFDSGWNYRRAVTISNPGLLALTDYQVHVTLNASFDFANAKSDGSDLRVTTADGTTLIPFWIEVWNPGTQQGSLWVKVPTLPTGGTTMFLYYGNPNAVNIGNNPNSVFAFYDGFDGTSLDGSKWSFANGSSSQAVETGGQVTLTGTSSSFVRIRSQQSFGMDTIVEARGRHPQQGVLNMVAEVGLIDSNFGDIVRIVDDFHPSIPTSTITWNRQAKLSGQPDINWSAMAQSADQQWHTFRVYRRSSNVAGFQIDENPVEEVSSNVPVSNLPVFFMSYTEGAINEFLVDWVRVRKFAYPEPIAIFKPVSANDPPVANGQSVTTPANASVSITLTGTDADGDVLTYAVVSGPAHGALSGQAPNLIYTPVANYSGPDSFTFKVNDGQVDSAAATVSIVVTVGPSWFDSGWNYRRTVTISNPGLSVLTDYQVHVTLNASFDFANAKSDGSDVRVTTADGTTLIPFWIEDWNPGTQQGNLWVKIPTLPVGGTTVFLYYGNPNAINIGNNPNSVFAFYDGFDGTSLDGSKWSIVNGSSSQAVEIGGQLILNANNSSFVRIRSQQSFGMDYMVEARGRHPQQGVLNMVAEVGLIDASFGNIVRIVDDFHPSLPTSTITWNRQAKLSGESDINWSAMAQSADQEWHTFRVYRRSPNVAGFQIDENPVEEVSSNVPVSNLPVFLMSYTEGAINEFLVDWVRVRKFAYPEPIATF